VNRIARFELVLLAAVPPLTFWLMHFRLIAQNTFLDPYIYTGYIHNFADLMARYGVTYYSVRFGMLLPSQAAAAIFGPIAGYVVLRYLLALLAGLPFYLLVRQRYGRTLAVAMFLLLMTSPWLARTLLWDYPDAAGVPFLFAGMCLFSLEHRRRLRLDACAGICLGMAVNSNVFALAPGGIYLGAYALLWVWSGRGAGVLVRRLLTIAAAVVLVSGAGVVYYWARVQRADIFTVSFQTATELLGGQIANWRTPGTAWLAQLRWALNPVVLLAIGLVACGRRLRGNFHEQVVWASAAGIAAFYFGTQFLLNETFLELFYYFSYSLPVTFLMLASIIAALWQQLEQSRHRTALAVLLTATTGPAVLRALDMWINPPFAMYLGFAALSVAIVALAANRPRTMNAMLATAAVGVLVALTFLTQPYRGMIASWGTLDSVEMDVYRTTLRFIASVPPLKEQPGEIRFWYSNEPSSSSIQSIQSAYLWGYSKLQGDGTGMPHLGESELEVVRDRSVKWLGLLARDEGELSRGRAALLEHGIAHTRLRHEVIEEGSFTLHFEMLALQNRD
jgi:hypothetical protein